MKLPAKHLILLSLLLSLQPVISQAESVAADHTMLMFIGEEAPLVTVASRLPESPMAAPALVTIIDRREIERRGYRTLGELLAFQPGFFIAAQSRGSIPYLRGLPNSVLFLYDGVPLTTDVTKSLAPLGPEISLAAVDRVEIVRGPGSVLWGADAFAGVINIVPLRGGLRPGLVMNMEGGSQRLHGTGFTWGRKEEGLESFLALNGSRQRFHAPDFIAEQGATDALDLSSYGEAVASVRYQDWLQLTGRWSDFTSRYTMQNPDGTVIWAGEKESPVNLLKVTAGRVSGSSHYTLSGFLQESTYLVRDADIERQQRNRAGHIEMLWDRRLTRARGLLSVGASWRHNMVDNAMVRDGFLPDFLTPGARLFVPQMEQEDFNNDLFSIFTQLRAQRGKLEWWIGGRLDHHSQYTTKPSYNFGFNRSMAENFRLKVAYGTAFRSPYSSQLFNNIDFEPESISTASAQLSWFTEDGRRLELTLFHSRVKDHRSEHPYGGLSLSAERKISGGELTGGVRLNKVLELSAALTIIDSSDEDEQFRTLLFSFLRPDGSQVEVYEDWREPFNHGPSWLAAATLNWRIGPEQHLMLGARIGGRTRYSYEKGTMQGSYHHPLLIDITYRRPGFFPDNDRLTLIVTNLLNQEHRQADLFGPTTAPPLRATAAWQYRF